MSYVRWRWGYDEPLVHLGPDDRMYGLTFCGLRTIWCFRVEKPEYIPTCFKCLVHPYAKSYEGA